MITAREARLAEERADKEWAEKHGGKVRAALGLFALGAAAGLYLGICRFAAPSAAPRD